MRLYSGMSADFMRDTARNQIAEKLKSAFFHYYRYNPSPGEVNAWRNSLRAVKDVLELGRFHDHGILLEYQLPLSSKRLDCMVCGVDGGSADNAVIIELKQWERCEDADPDGMVSTWVGGAHRDVLHPSVQVGQYAQYLEDTHTAFHEGNAPVRVSACSFLHNYVPASDDPILAPKFREVLGNYPLFNADGVDALSEYLGDRLLGGHGERVLSRVEQSRLRPARKLMDHVAATINAQSPWILLDEQLVVFERIRSAVAAGRDSRTKQVILVRGGPGTGKSVLAINLVARFLRENVNAQYATGSRAFTETLWKILGTRSKSVFRYFNSYRTADLDAVDVIVCDEAHRIRKTSDGQYTPKASRTDKPQIQEILDASRVSVFFVDDRQVVRPNEIGSSAHVREHAEKCGAKLHEYELEVQFRCSGSDGFVNWIDNTLGIRRTANVMWDGAEGFDFRIFGSPTELESAIRARAGQGASARLAAGFCWPWSPPQADGSLVADVEVGEFRRPWNAKPDAKKLARGIPPASLWATDAGGIEQVGCVYTIQGFEMDYVGVIWGLDLVYDFDAQSWKGQREHSRDTVVKRSKDRFLDLVKNTYRVLLSRGMKGCYVHFLDRDTERFLRSRLEQAGGLAEALRVAEGGSDYP